MDEVLAGGVPLCLDVHRHVQNRLAAAVSTLAKEVAAVVAMTAAWPGKFACAVDVRRHCQTQTSCSN